MKRVIEVQDLSYRYPDGTEALKGVSFSIDWGTKTVLLGPNGSGKSTLIMHLNGVFLPQKGKVFVDGQEVTKKTEQTVRRKVGIVFQDPDDQVFASTVWEDVAFGLFNLGMQEKEIKERVEEVLKLVGVWHLRNRIPYHLSYGEKKKVALAGVLVMEPEIVVLDEPGTYLDPQGKRELFWMLDELCKNRKTLLIATHDVDLAAEWADKVIILKEGRVLKEGGKDLLLEEEVLAEANLVFPRISELFLRAGFPKEKVPFTVEEAIRVLKGAIR
ncbi:ATP-binding cassette domain-containing protein [Thermatribacter velox]|uniref:ABC transporter ATP-binding protein n=1 Tax=Thermatribacter velox TaxID=3039681 RepID=A0ABZ2YDM3_9BACT